MEGMSETLESLQGVMDDNAADAAGAAYEEAYEEYYDLLDEYYEVEEEAYEFEDELYGLEEEQLWDDTAAAYDAYVFAELEFEYAVERESNAQDELDAAWEEYDLADQELWEAQFDVDNQRTNEEYILA